VCGRGVIGGLGGGARGCGKEGTGQEGENGCFDGENEGKKILFKD